MKVVFWAPSEIYWTATRSVVWVLVRKRSELKFTPTKREKQSVAALHEYFRNEVGVNFGHLQREQEPKPHSLSFGLSSFADDISSRVDIGFPVFAG